MNWYLKVLKNYVGFTGRARRKEFWMFALFNIIFSVVATMIDSAAGLADPMTGTGPIAGLYGLAVLLPGIAVGARRLHDTGRTGWLLLLALIPLIGAIVLLVFFVQDSKPGPNKYGPNPKEEGAVVTA